MQILANRNFRFAKIWLFYIIGQSPGFYWNLPVLRPPPPVLWCQGVESSGFANEIVDVIKPYQFEPEFSSGEEGDVLGDEEMEEEENEATRTTNLDW